MLMPDNLYLSDGRDSRREQPDDEPLIVPFDDSAPELAHPLFQQRPRRVMVGRSIAVAGLTVLTLLAIVLSMSGVWQAVSGSLRTALHAVHSPVLVAESPVPWAQVWVDGHKAGRVGARIPLSLGAHTITVRAAGFAPYTRQLSFGDVLQALHSELVISVPERVLPGVVPQMTEAINRTLDAFYGVDSITRITPGEMYAPGQVARVPLRARLTLTMVTNKPAFHCQPADLSCEQRAADAIVNAYPCLSSTSGCISPYLTLLDSWGTAGEKAVASIQVHLDVQFFDTSSGRLVYSRTIPTPGYQGDLVIIWPGSNGWQVSPALATPDMLSGLQTDAGDAALQALLPARAMVHAVPPFMQIPLHPISEGMLLILPFGPDAGATWLFHFGMLFAVDLSAHRLTPALPPVPAMLYPWLQQAAGDFLHHIQLYMVPIYAR